MSAGRPTVFYHGTSLEAILSIQENGFRVDLSGTNAGAALGPGVYITTTLEKSLHYAKGTSESPNPAAGGVLVLQVDLGRCYAVRSNSLVERTGWAEQGYDSAWSAEGIIGAREENCVRNPARIVVSKVVLANTGAARRLGYEVRGGRLEVVQASEAQAQAQAAIARGRAEFWLPTAAGVTDWTPERLKAAGVTSWGTAMDRLGPTLGFWEARRAAMAAGFGGRG